MQPVTDACWGIAHGLRPADVDAALREARDRGRPASAVLVVSPTYYGYVSNMTGGRAPLLCQQYTAARSLCYLLVLRTVHTAQRHGHCQLKRVSHDMVACTSLIRMPTVAAALADVCHSHGAVLIVDEAHGAHSALRSTYNQVPWVRLCQGSKVYPC